MAWEWVPPVSAATGTAIVGGIGIWATYRTGREDRKHAEALAKQTAEHAEKMAVDAREHKHFEEAYIELLQMTARLGHWPTSCIRSWTTTHHSHCLTYRAATNSTAWKRW